MFQEAYHENPFELFAAQFLVFSLCFFSTEIRNKQREIDFISLFKKSQQ